MTPTLATDQRVDAGALQTLVTEIFVRCKINQANAALLGNLRATATQVGINHVALA